MANFTSYVICTSPRSGSTLLCKLLAGTGQSGNPSSLFHRPSLSAWLKAYQLSDRPFADEREALHAVFRAARDQGTGGTGIFGLRLQRHSFAFFTEKLALLHPTLAADGERFQAAFGKTLFIHLTRSNKLEQAISLVKANQTGLWHMRSDGTELERLSEPKDPVYDADEIARNLAQLTAFDLDWNAWFQTEGIDPMQVSYDQLSADPKAVLSSILDRLGLDPTLADGITPPVAKLADATNRAWARRFVTEPRVIAPL